MREGAAGEAVQWLRSGKPEPSMTETAISPLRQRMIDDVTVRHFVEETRTDHIRQIGSFTAFPGRSSDTASPENMVYRISRP